MFLSKYKFFTPVIVLGVLAMILVVGLMKKRAYEKQISDLQGMVASKEQTIEIKDGLFKKASEDVKNLSSLLSSKDKEVSSLKEEIKRNKEEILSVTTTSLQWKKNYEALMDGKQTEIPGASPGSPSRSKVEFSKDFGYIGVDGYTLTNPPTAFVSVKQNRPLKLDIVMTQSKDGKWNSYVTSSEENMNVSVGVSAVNSKLLDRKWYERLGLSLSAGAGKAVGMGSAGILYDANKFEFGPTIWSVVADKNYQFYGMTFVWRPFARVK